MTTVERVARAIRENPEGLLLLGAGVALMLRKAGNARTASSAARSRYYDSAAYDSSAYDAANDTGEGLRDRASAAVDDARTFVSDTAQDLSEKASEYGQRTRDAADSAYRATRDAASSAYESMENVVDTHPVTIAVAGLAAGCLAAAVFPSTRFERDTLGPIGRRAAEAASETGEMVKSAAVARVTKAAAKAGEQLKDAVSDRKLNTDNAGEVARNVASTAANSMSGTSTGTSSGDSEAAKRQAATRTTKAQL